MSEYFLKDLKKLLVDEQKISDSAICAIEEMSELSKVLCKLLRNSEKFNIHDLIEELSHTLLMVETIQKYFNISDESINNQQLTALNKWVISRRTTI